MSALLYSVRSLKRREELTEGLIWFIKLPPEEKAKVQTEIRRKSLTVDEARAAVLARLEAGEEPTGSEIGDLLTVDKVTQYVFKRLWHDITEASKPEEMLQLQPLRMVVAA
jgi:hypothetical protein